MQDLLSDPDFGRLATFSANTFLEFGFDVKPFAAMGDEPPDMLGAATADGFTDALVMPPTSWQDQHHVALASAFASHDGWDPPYVDVDAMSPVGRPPGAYVLLAYWNSTKQRVEVTACKTGSKNPRKGARRCRIVPLEG